MSTVHATDDELATGLHLLEAGIPMTLLLDLASGPHSVDLYLSEEGNTEWLPATVTSYDAVRSRRPVRAKAVRTNTVIGAHSAPAAS